MTTEFLANGPPTRADTGLSLPPGYPQALDAKHGNQRRAPHGPSRKVRTRPAASEAAGSADRLPSMLKPCGLAW
jgi:hypothetical protein